MLRVVDELLWTLRRSGFLIATSQAIDVARAVHAVGFEDRDVLRDAVACIVVHRARERGRFDELFDRFFAARTRAGSLWERLEGAGFGASELDALKDLLGRVAASGGDGAQHLGALLERGPELDRVLALAGMRRALDAQSRLQLGFTTYRLLQRAGMTRARESLGVLRAQLRDALGEERGDLLADALAKELDSASADIRAFVEEAFASRDAELEAERRGPRKLEESAFTSLSEQEIDEVRRAVRRFAERLRGGERVRARRARRGRIDPHRTFRSALRTGGVPFAPARRRRRRDKPRLMLLCDVSDSVRAAAGFMLEFVYAAQELFERTRSFVFVSELGETTQLFARETVNVALGQAYGGGVVSVSDNSNYGRVLRAFEAHALAPDRPPHDGGHPRRRAHELPRRRRPRSSIASASAPSALLWLCPEATSEWALGDSAMSRYAPKCTAVFEVRSARELEDAGRAIVARR